MPWSTKKQGNKWVIIRSDTGQVVGHSDSKANAEASIRARYASKHGHRMGEPAIRNMREFVRDVVTKILAEERDIDGQIYTLVPQDIREALSGSMAAAFGIVKRDGQMWVPKGKAQALAKTHAEIEKDLRDN
jgi:hypothetical protein